MRRGTLARPFTWQLPLREQVTLLMVAVTHHIVLVINALAHKDGIRFNAVHDAKHSMLNKKGIRTLPTSSPHLKHSKYTQ